MCKCTRSLNYYLAQPCFILTIEKQWGKSASLFPFLELERLYEVWLDGLSMGKYAQATKDAEGT